MDARDDELDESLNELYLRSKHSSLYHPQLTVDEYTHSATHAESVQHTQQVSTLVPDPRGETEPDRAQSLLLSAADANIADGTLYPSRERCDSSNSSSKQRNTIVSLLRNRRQGP